MAATRSTLLFAGFSALLAATASIAAIGAEYPVRPIRLVVPFTPGGGTDIIARALGQHLGSAFGQDGRVDDAAGGHRVLGTPRPDGYTLMVQINTLTALPALMKDGQGSISLAQFSPVSLVAALPHVL